MLALFPHACVCLNVFRSKNVKVEGLVCLDIMRRVLSFGTFGIVLSQISHLYFKSAYVKHLCFDFGHAPVTL